MTCRPKAEADKSRPAKAASPLRSAKGSGPRILIVEDEAELRKLAVRFLSDKGYAVLAAKDGKSALALFEEASDIKLLFTDIMLPGKMSGIDLAKRVRARAPSLKVLYTSGNAADAITEKGELRKSYNFIQKPYLRKDLAVRVQKLLDEDGKKES